MSAGPLEAAPFVLTLGVDAAAQAEFDRLRRAHFPAKLNRIPAHITLFHALPGAEAQGIRQLLSEVAAGTTPFALDVTGLKKLGRGVAYVIEARELDALHGRLRSRWLPWLTPQDAQPFRPHVVIQNKVMPHVAAALYEDLAGSFRPWTIPAASLLLWRYLGGPWALDTAFSFAAA